MKNNVKIKNFIGIDISKAKIDVALLVSISPLKFLNSKFKNNLEGFEKLNNWIKKQNLSFKDSLFCMETTGHYGWLLMSWLSSQEAFFVEESALKIKKSLGIARGHEDKLDARRIAKYAFEKQHSLNFSEFKSGNILQIKVLLTHRQQLVKQSVMIKNNIHFASEVNEVVENKLMIRQLEEHLEFVKAQKTEIETRIDEIIKENEEIKKNYELTKSVTGIGPVNAWFLIAFTNNFKDFSNGRKYAAFIGVAPYPFQSGTIDKGSKVSFYSHKLLKVVLSNAATSAMTTDPQLKTYLNRKLDEGKHEGKIYNAIKFKLILRIFAVVKRGTPYQKLNF